MANLYNMHGIIHRWRGPLKDPCPGVIVCKCMSIYTVFGDPVFVLKLQPHGLPFFLSMRTAGAI